MTQTHAQRNEKARTRMLAHYARPENKARHATQQKAKRAADPEGERAKGRSRQNRRAAKIAWFSRKTNAVRLEEISEYEQRGLSVLNARQLARPFLIFELRGVRKYEPWPGAN